VEPGAGDDAPAAHRTHSPCEQAGTLATGLENCFLIRENSRISRPAFFSPPFEQFVKNSRSSLHFVTFGGPLATGQLK